MANRKEDEKNERIIRGLLKLPENRRCINCNSLVRRMSCYFNYPSHFPLPLVNDLFEITQFKVGYERIYDDKL